MTALRALAARLTPALAKLCDVQWIPVLLIRLFVGYFFFETGLGKVGDLAGLAERFEGWGISFPAFNAALSAYTELLGGALLVLGLTTRLVAIPLFINMAVAITVVNMKRVTELDEFFDLSEPLYALCFVLLFFAGGGPVSLDRLLRTPLMRGGAPGGPPPSGRAPAAGCSRDRRHRRE